MCHACEHIRFFPEQCDQGDEHDRYFRTKIHAVRRRTYHLLGLWAIGKWKLYRGDHFMSEAWSGECRGMNDSGMGQNGKEGESEARVKPSTRLGTRDG